MNTAEELKVRLTAGYPLIGLETDDDAAADRVLGEALADVAGEVWEYDNARGGISFGTKLPLQGDHPFADDASVQMDCAMRLATFLDRVITDCRPVSCTLVLKDVSEQLSDPVVSARLKVIAGLTAAAATKGEAYRVQVVIVSRSVEFPRELSATGVVIRLEPPTREESYEIVRRFAARRGLTVDDRLAVQIAEALRGLSGDAMVRTLGCVLPSGKAFSPTTVADIRAEKARLMHRGGVLEMVDVSQEDASIGGMANLLGYLSHVSRILANAEQARRCGVDMPRGILIAGMPGCGKSLAAKCAAKTFGVPLMRLDAGRLMGKYVGESERNLREALAVAEATAPCVLWIDEIEKAFAGVGKDSDGGVATRLFGHFLTWMNEQKSSVYTIATANDITGLPPELMRRGRFDELFAVDLPETGECRKILEIQLARRGYALEGSELDRLAKNLSSRGASGADVESLVKIGVALSFDRFVRGTPVPVGSTARPQLEPNEMSSALRLIHTVSETMKSKIDELRKRLKDFDMNPANSCRKSASAETCKN